jgi:uncharacterized membrane protein
MGDPGKADVVDEEYKVIAALGYVVFFLPLVLCPKDQFARFHANQGLNLLLISFLLGATCAMIPVVGWILIMPLGLITSLYALLGIVTALRSKRRHLPLIGHGLRLLPLDE